MRLVSINEAVRKEKIMKVSVDTTKKKKEEPMTGKKRFMSLLRSLVKMMPLRITKIFLGGSLLFYF